MKVQDAIEHAERLGAVYQPYLHSGPSVRVVGSVEVADRCEMAAPGVARAGLVVGVAP